MYSKGNDIQRGGSRGGSRGGPEARPELLVAPYVMDRAASRSGLLTGPRVIGLALGVAALWALTGLPGSPSGDAGTIVASPISGTEPAIRATPATFGPPIEADPNTPPAQRKLALRLASGDTLIDTLTDAGAPVSGAYRAVAALGEALDVRRLQVGQEIDLVLEANAYQLAYGNKEDSGLWKLASFSVRSEFDQRVVIVQAPDSSYRVATETIPTVALTRFGKGIINDSLFLSAERADVPPEVIIELIRIFSFSVDFQREIWPGDTFAIYYERTAIWSGLEVREGNILYARLTLRGKEHSFYRFDPGTSDGKPGRIDYFDGNGKSARRALMKTPIDGARLSSRYGRRKHPVLGYVRNHPGVDFSTGRSGTPIYAAGDGVILRASRYSTYGNYIKIRHNSTYQTAYAHLSKYGRGIRKGVRVKQGQIIGYVGATGQVTGPHLHYEVFVNGTRINPTTLKLPTGKTLTGAALSAFQQVRLQVDNSVASLQAFQMMVRDMADERPDVEGRGGTGPGIEALETMEAIAPGGKAAPSEGEVEE